MARECGRDRVESELIRAALTYIDRKNDRTVYYTRITFKCFLKPLSNSEYDSVSYYYYKSGML